MIKSREKGKQQCSQYDTRFWKYRICQRNRSMRSHSRTLCLPLIITVTICLLCSIIDTAGVTIRSAFGAVVRDSFLLLNQTVNLVGEGSESSLESTHLGPAVPDKRRYYDPVANCMSKTTQYVILPEYLDVAPYCAYNGANRHSWAGTVKAQQERRPLTTSIHYRLMSVIEHRGGAFHGHYVCYRRDPSNGRWLYISDDSVKSCDWNEVRRCQAYMLFYEAI
jgi:hypothetical protein